MMGRLPCPPPCSHQATDRWPWGQRTRCWSQSTANCSTVYAPSTCVCHPWLGRVGPRRMMPWSSRRSCLCRLRLNLLGSPVDRHRGKKAWTRELSWLPSGPLSPGDALKAGRLDTRHLLRSPPCAVSYHHALLTDPLAGATAARERAAPLSRSRRDRSGPRPSPAYKAATVWPSPCHWWVLVRHRLP